MSDENITIKVITNSFVKFFQIDLAKYLENRHCENMCITRDENGEDKAIEVTFDGRYVDDEEALSIIKYFFDNYNKENAHKIGMQKQKVSKFASNLKIKKAHIFKEFVDRVLIELKVYHG